jgi:cytochrome c oxidase cbb3-type subunit 1
MMDDFVRRFIRASLVWLGVGVAIGIAMAFWPGQAIVYRPAHMHANLLGFVSMMIFGVAYHVIPRFSGAPLHRHRLAEVHFLVANAGLALLVSAWMTRAAFPRASSYPLRLGAALSALGAGLFIYNLWRTLNAGDAAARRHRSHPLPTPSQVTSAPVTLAPATSAPTTVPPVSSPG